MISRSGNRLALAGALTSDTVAGLVAAGLKEIAAGASVVDLKDVSAVDSTAISLLFEWKRRSPREIKFCNFPLELKNLAVLYGVLEMIPEEENDQR